LHKNLAEFVIKSHKQMRCHSYAVHAVSKNMQTCFNQRSVKYLPR